MIILILLILIFILYTTRESFESDLSNYSILYNELDQTTNKRDNKYINNISEIRYKKQNAFIPKIVNQEKPEIYAKSKINSSDYSFSNGYNFACVKTDRIYLRDYMKI